MYMRRRRHLPMRIPSLHPARRAWAALALALLTATTAVIVPARPASAGTEVISTLAGTGSPGSTILVLIVVLFLTVQNRIDRNDPKLALAPVRSEPLSFIGPASLPIGR